MTGTLTFGTIPAVVLDGAPLAEAHIFLAEGKHMGPNRGFGARHIWAEHRREMAAAGLMAEADVPLFVLRIIRSGTPLIYRAQAGE